VANREPKEDMNDQEKQHVEETAVEEYKRLWDAMYEERLPILDAALTSESRRTALLHELRARAEKDCVFLEVNASVVDPETGIEATDKKGKTKFETQRLWDGKNRDSSTGAPTPDARLADEWVSWQMQLAEQTITQRVRERAVSEMEDAADFVPPVVEFHDLDDLEAADIPEVQYRIERMHNVGGSMFLAAQAKAGKTSVSLNMVRSLADGLPFLDRAVVPVERRIMYWDFELPPSYGRQQVLNMRIQNKKKVTFFGLKGQKIPLHTEGAKRWAIDHLRKYDVEVWFIDTLSRLFVGDEDSNTDMRRFVTALEEVQRLAGVKEIYLIHHAGHAKDGQKIRARGASALLGDFDTNVTLERVNPKDEEDTQRLMRIIGRGDFDPTIYYDWDPETKFVSAMDSGSVVKKTAGKRKKDEDWAADLTRVYEYVRHHARCSRKDLENELGLAEARIPRLLEQLEERGVCEVSGDGKNGTVLNKKYYFVPDTLRPNNAGSPDV
jgi:hypothetical protein